MTFREASEQAGRSAVLVFAAQVASIATAAIAPLIVAGLVQGLSLLREHDRTITTLVSQRQQTAEDVAYLRARMAELAAQQARTDQAAAGYLARLEAITQQLVRIERLLERERP